MTPQAAVAASTRTPTKRQTQALFAVNLASCLTEAVHAWRTTTAERAGKGIAETPRDTYTLLVTCDRYGWVERAFVDLLANGTNPNEGAGIRWNITNAGREALERGRAAIRSTEESTMEAGTAGVEAPWYKGVQETHHNQQPDEHDGDDGTQEEQVVEGEVEDPAEDDNPPVNEGASQLTLAIGGPKPKSSILKVLARQQKFGTTRQFKQLERIPFSGVLEVRSIEVKTEATGHVTRTHRAIIAEFVLDGAELENE